MAVRRRRRQSVSRLRGAAFVVVVQTCDPQIFRLNAIRRDLIE